MSYTNEGMDLQAYTTLKRWMNVEYPTLSAPPDADLLTEVTNLFLEAARKGPAARRAPQESRIDSDVQIGLGVLFYNSGDYDKAVDCFASALSVRPQDYKLWSRLGATLANSGKSEEAIDAYYKALQLKPSFVRGSMSWVKTHHDYRVQPWSELHQYWMLQRSCGALFRSS